MKVVIDCNVIVAAARTDGVCRAALRDIVHRHELVLSWPIVEEYRTVGARPKHKTYHGTMLAITHLLEQIAEIVEPVGRTFGLIDPDDEIYLATGDRRWRRCAGHGEQKAFSEAALRPCPDRDAR